MNTEHNDPHYVDGTAAGFKGNSPEALNSSREAAEGVGDRRRDHGDGGGLAGGFEELSSGDAGGCLAHEAQTIANGSGVTTPSGRTRRRRGTCSMYSKSNYIQI